MEPGQVESGKENWISNVTALNAAPTAGAEQQRCCRAMRLCSANRTGLHSIKLKNLPKYRMNGEKKSFICHMI